MAGELVVPTIEDLEAKLEVLAQHIRSRYRLKGEDFLNLKHIGAKGDGVTNDTAAFQEANEVGGLFLLPPGNYIAEDFIIGQNVSFCGSGIGNTSIKLKGGSNKNLVTLLDASGSLLTNLTLDGNRGQQTTNLDASVLTIDTNPDNLLSSYHLSVQNVLIKYGFGDNLRLLGKDNGGANAWYNWVFDLSNIWIEKCGRYGLYDETSDNRYSNFYFTENDYADMYLKTASSNLYNNFKVGEGGRLKATSSPNKVDGANVILNGVQRCSFTNFDIQSGFMDGLYAKDSRYLTFTGVDSQNNDGWGFYFENCKAVRGSISTSAIATSLFNGLGDVYIDKNCKDIELDCVPSSTTGAAPLKVVNAGQNCYVRVPNADLPVASVRNVLANSNFASVSGWQANNKTAASNTLTWKAKFQYDQMIGYFAGVLGHKYYVKASVQSTSSSVGLYLGPNTQVFYPAKMHTGSGAFETLSGVVNLYGNDNVANSAFVIMDSSTSAWANISVRYAVCIDLTEAFGLGKEPTAEEMDALLETYPSSWFTGLTSVRGSRYSSVSSNQILNERSRKGTAAPTTGHSNVGEIVWNASPATGSHVGWVCTVAGNPGTWKGFGQIA